MTRIAALFGAAALVGCASIDDSQDAGISSQLPEVATPENAAFGVFATYANGLLAPNDTFDLKDKVHVDVAPRERIVVSHHPDGAGGDYYFQVVDGNGVIVSQDDISCRRIHIDAKGQIDKVYAGTDAFGAACEHKHGYDGAGGMTVQLMPYGDSSMFVVDAGVKKEVFDVMLTPAPADPTGGGVIFLKQAPTYRFYIALSSPSEPTDPVCGDGRVDPGEECDDGNTHGQDGCSATCKVEHLCCCGNGVVEPGELCDDGNNIDGDGCSSTCVTE